MSQPAGNPRPAGPSSSFWLTCLTRGRHAVSGEALISMKNPIVDPRLFQRLAEAEARLKEIDGNSRIRRCLATGRDSEHWAGSGRSWSPSPPRHRRPVAFRKSTSRDHGLAEESDDPEMRELVEEEMAGLKEGITVPGQKGPRASGSQGPPGGSAGGGRGPCRDGRG